MTGQYSIPDGLLSPVLDHALRDYPAECCGMIFAAKNTSRLTRIRACENVQDSLHRRDPVQFPRTAKTAYAMAPQELFAIEQELRDREERIALIYHSHIETDAYFSDEDFRRATFGEPPEPLYPGTVYLVLSVRRREGKPIVAAQKQFGWDPDRRAFPELGNGGGSRNA